MKCGASVEVLAPPELRKEIEDEIARMTKIYKDVEHLLGE